MEWQLSHTWGDTASVLGFIITILLFIVTWIMQWIGRAQVRRALSSAARMVVQDALGQFHWKIQMINECVDNQAWRRALDFCGDAQRLAMGMLGNPNLTLQEISSMRDHADDLELIKGYLRRTKLVENPPANFPANRRQALANMASFGIGVQVRLQAIVWE